MTLVPVSGIIIPRGARTVNFVALDVLDRALDLPKNRLGHFVRRLANRHLRRPGVEIADVLENLHIHILRDGKPQPLRRDGKGTVDRERLKEFLGGVRVQPGHEALRAGIFEIVAIVSDLFRCHFQNCRVELRIVFAGHILSLPACPQR